MSSFRNPPTAGKGKNYEPNFKVKVEGLDAIVALALSDRRERFVLGRMDKLPVPLSEVLVYLMPNVCLESGEGYVVEATISPVGEKLNVELPHYANAWFEVRSTREGDRFSLSKQLTYCGELEVVTSPLSLLPPFLTSKGWPRYSGEGLVVRQFETYQRLIHEKVRGKAHVESGVTAFADALAITVNSAYSCAAQSSPRLTLFLAAPTEPFYIDGPKGSPSLPPHNQKQTVPAEPPDTRTRRELQGTGAVRR